MLRNREDAFKLPRDTGAPERLVNHAQLVVQAADRLLIEFQSLGISLDIQVVELGAILHDVGKTRHPEELSNPGLLHEQAGEALLLQQGVEPSIARVCATHGAWNLPGVSLEERTGALADKLWKGKREDALELSIIDEIARRMGGDRWDIFERLDSAFEEIAADGADRVRETMTK